MLLHLVWLTKLGSGVNIGLTVCCFCAFIFCAFDLTLCLTEVTYKCIFLFWLINGSDKLQLRR